MKFYQLLALFIIPAFSQAQNVNPKYYNKIAKVDKIVTTNSEISIKNADTVIIQIFITNNSKWMLDGYDELRDTSGNYLTFFHFICPDELSCDFNLTLKFNSAAIGNLNITPQESESFIQLL